MARQPDCRFDEIGYWSEVKLDIIKEYAKQYSTILAAQKQTSLSHVYIDAFAGAGVHLSKTSGATVPGSPLIALKTEPPFREYHFIDLDGQKAQHLRDLTVGMPTVHVYNGDCNNILLNQVFPKVKFKDYRRGLCLLDPYGLHLDWKVIASAGQSGSIEIFLNFPIMDMNRNVLWHDTEKVGAEEVARMNAFWGDETWRDAAYETQAGLFDDIEEKASNRAVAEAFRKRLNKVA